MATLVDDMRSAGFDDATIGSWANEQRPAMKQAGFDDATIESYFSGLKNPASIPRPFMSRFKSWLDSSTISDAAVEGAKAGFGEGPLGPTEEETAKLRSAGVYNDYGAPGGTIGGPVRGLRMANETLIPALTVAAQAMMRVPMAALMGTGAVIGQGISDATGSNDSEAARARRDWAQIIPIGALLAGSVSPTKK